MITLGWRHRAPSARTLSPTLAYALSAAIIGFALFAYGDPIAVV